MYAFILEVNSKDSLKKRPKKKKTKKDAYVSCFDFYVTEHDFLLVFIFYYVLALFSGRYSEGMV